MKNLFYLSVLVLTAGLTACAADDITDDGRNFQYAGREGCSDTLIKEQPRVAPAPVRPVCGCAQTQPNCGCQTREYTVRTPVKVVYKNTTYRTVYEPRTFETTSYETRPYNRAEACTDGSCAPMGMRPVNHTVVPAQQPVPYQPQPMPYQQLK